MKNNTNKILKISSIVVLVVAMLWFFLWTLPSGGESSLVYKEIIKGEQGIHGYGCYSSLVGQVDGLFCNDYPELANLDGNPEYSETEKMLTRAIQVHNSRISDSTFNASNTFWLLLIIIIVVVANLIYDLKSKK